MIAYTTKAYVIIKKSDATYLVDKKTGNVSIGPSVAWAKRLIKSIKGR